MRKGAGLLPCPTKKEVRMNKYLDKNDYEPLACELCHKDLLETGMGNCVWAGSWDQAATLRYADVYCVCKGRCDMLLQAALHDAKYSASWIGIDELMNPLMYERWDRATSRLIDQGAVSVAAIAKVEELKRIVAPIADREPTEQDLARFREISMIAGL